MKFTILKRHQKDHLKPRIISSVILKFQNLQEYREELEHRKVSQRKEKMKPFNGGGTEKKVQKTHNLIYFQPLQCPERFKLTRQFFGKIKFISIKQELT